MLRTSSSEKINASARDLLKTGNYASAFLEAKDSETRLTEVSQSQGGRSKAAHTKAAAPELAGAGL